MVYKVNFLIRMVTLLSFDLVLPFVTIMIYQKTNGFANWSFNEILLFQGVFILVNGIDKFFFRRSNWFLASDVRNGNFDRYLLYPVDTVQYVAFVNLAVEEVAQILIGASLIVYSIFKLNIILNFWNVFLFIVFILLGVLFLFSLQLIQYSVILRSVMIGRLGEFMNTVKRYGEYPVEIYNLSVSFVLRYAMPLAILAYYPSELLLRNISSNVIIAVVIIFIFLAFSIVFWRSSLKNYASAGG